MRWRDPNYGDSRVVKRFSIVPIKAGGECCWLEFVSIQQRWCERWENERFADKTKQ